MRKKGAKNLFTLGGKMKYYLKKPLVIMVYLISSGIIASSVLAIDGLAWLKLVLLILNFALFIFIFCGMAVRDGEKALRVRISNDKMRELIVKTGDDYKLDLDGEFAVRKGFFAGAFACLPLVVMILLTLLARDGSATETVLIQAIQLFYMVFYGFFNLDFLEVYKDVLYSSYYWALVAIPVLTILHGVFYYFGARKVEKQQEYFKSTHRALHGE